MDNYKLRENLKTLRTAANKSVPSLLKDTGISISANTYLSYEDSRSNSPKYHVARALAKYYSEIYNMDINIESLYEADFKELLEDEIGKNENEGIDNNTNKNENEIIQLRKLDIQKIDAETAKIKAEIELLKLMNKK